MKDIRIDVGVCTALNINLSNVDFTAIKEVIFTVKNYASTTSPVIIERKFTTAEMHEIIVQPDESIKLTEHAVYDFDMVLKKDNSRLKMTDNGNIILRRGVGGCADE